MSINGRWREQAPVSVEARGASFQILSEQAFSRAVGARLIEGNRVRILRDAAENYPAWLSAIESARERINFESYIIHEDEQGERFAQALMEKARSGVHVRLIYDWMGALTATSNRFWRRLSDAGVEVRCFNPPQIDSPLAWLGRDHRKTITVDGKIGFVTGLCVGRMWAGDPRKGLAPWRDTGIELQGPAIPDLERAFARMWALTGAPMPEQEVTPIGSTPAAGDVSLRVVASEPNTAGIYRLDQMIAAAARETLWLTDAYFAGTTPYVQALCSAAQDGVDVRLLVPAATDIPVVRAISRAGYRPLLEAGVRIFEWNGTMIHAKTAVADGCWARIGSTNLNLASWITNWELDVVVEDERIGVEMEETYLEDLQNATEIVLTERRRLAPITRRERRRFRQQIDRGSSSRAAAGALEIGRAVGAAITNRRLLGPAEARLMGTAALLLSAIAIILLLWPRVFVVPLSIFCLWIAASLALKAWRLHGGKQEARGSGNRQEAVGSSCKEAGGSGRRQ